MPKEQGQTGEQNMEEVNQDVEKNYDPDFNYELFKKYKEGWVTDFKKNTEGILTEQDEEIADLLLREIEELAAKWVPDDNGKSTVEMSDAERFRTLVNTADVLLEMYNMPDQRVTGVYVNSFDSLVTAMPFVDKGLPASDHIDSCHSLFKDLGSYLSKIHLHSDGTIDGYFTSMYPHLEEWAENRKKCQDLLNEGLQTLHITEKLKSHRYDMSGHEQLTGKIMEAKNTYSKTFIKDLLPKSYELLLNELKQKDPEAYRKLYVPAGNRKDSQRARRYGENTAHNRSRYVPDSVFQNDISSEMTDVQGEPIFHGGGPTPEDVIQNQDGTCFMLSALRSMAQNDPERITNMIHDNGDGTVTVRFQEETEDGHKQPLDITINKSVPRLDPGSTSWVRLIEKAYAASGLRKYYQKDGNVFNADRNHPSMEYVLYGDSLEFMEHIYPEQLKRVNNGPAMSGTGDYEASEKMISDEIHKIMAAKGTVVLNRFNHAIVLQGIEGEGINAKVWYYNQWNGSHPDSMTVKELLENSGFVSIQAVYPDQGGLSRQDIPINAIRNKLQKDMRPLTKENYLQLIHGYYGHFLNEIYNNYGKEPEMQGFEEGNARTNRIFKAFRDNRNDYLMAPVLTPKMDFDHPGTYGAFVNRLNDPVYQKQLIIELLDSIPNIRSRYGNKNTYDRQGIDDLEKVLTFARDKGLLAPEAEQEAPQDARAQNAQRAQQDAKAQNAQQAQPDAKVQNAQQDARVQNAQQARQDAKAQNAQQDAKAQNAQPEDGDAEARLAEARQNFAGILNERIKDISDQYEARQQMRTLHAGDFSMWLALQNTVSEIDHLSEDKLNEQYVNEIAEALKKEEAMTAFTNALGDAPEGVNLTFEDLNQAYPVWKSIYDSESRRDIFDAKTDPDIIREINENLKKEYADSIALYRESMQNPRKNTNLSFSEWMTCYCVNEMIEESDRFLEEHREADNEIVEDDEIDEENAADQDESELDEERKDSDQDAEAKRLAEEEAKRLEEEEAEAKRLEEEEEAKRLEEEEEAKRLEEEAARQKAQEEAARQKAQEEAAKQKAQEEAAKQKAQAEAAKQKAQAEAARQKALEDAEKQKAAEVKKQEQSAHVPENNAVAGNQNAQAPKENAVPGEQSAQAPEENAVPGEKSAQAPEENVVPGDQSALQHELSEEEILVQAEALKARFEEFTRQMNQNQNLLNKLASYNTFSKTLTHLVNDLMKPYYEEIINFEGADGYQKMSPETFRELLTTYNELLNASTNLSDDINKLLNAKEDKPAEKDAELLKNIAASLNYAGSFMEKDIAALSDIEPTEAIILPEVIRKARTRQISIDSKDIHIVGGNLSRRIPLTWKDEEGKEHKGFFTRDKIIHFKDQVRNYMFNAVDATKVSDKAKHMVKQYLAALFQTPEIANDPEQLRWFVLDSWDYEEGSPRTNLADDFINMGKYKSSSFKDQDLFFHLYGKGKKENWTPEQLDNRDGFIEIAGDKKENREANVQKYFRGIVDALNAELEKNYTDMKLDQIPKRSKYLISRCEGSSIAQRNSAMSAVANLLGVGHLIAHSENMTVNVDGKPVEGVFMEQAQGEDLDRVTKDSKLYKMVQNEKGFSAYNLQVNKDLFSLQVLDYLCNNVDRHAFNVMYKVNKDNNAIIGLQGIDNDRSFGNNVFHENAGFQMNIEAFAMNLQGLVYIPEKMAASVLSLNPAMLDLALKGFQLTEPERNAACKRLEQLKEAIKANRLQVVDDQFLSDARHMYNYVQLIKSYDLFTIGRVLVDFKNSVIRMVETNEAKAKKANQEANEIKYAQADYKAGEGVANTNNPEAMKAAANALQKEKTDFIDRLDKTIETFEGLYTFFDDIHTDISVLDKAKRTKLSDFLKEAYAACIDMKNMLAESNFSRAYSADTINKYVAAMKQLAENSGIYHEMEHQLIDPDESTRKTLDRLKTINDLAISGESLPRLLEKPEGKQSGKKITFAQFKRYLEGQFTHDAQGHIQNTVKNGSQYISHKLLEEINRIGEKKFDEAGYSREELQAVYDRLTKPYGYIYQNYFNKQLPKNFNNISYEEADQTYLFVSQHMRDLQEIQGINKPNGDNILQEDRRTLRRQQIYDRIYADIPAQLNSAYKDGNDAAIQNIKDLAKQNNQFANWTRDVFTHQILSSLGKKNLAGLEKERQKYAGLDCDMERVYRDLDDYVQAHQNMSEEQIAEEKKNLVIREAIVASNVKLAQKTGRPLAESTALASKLRNSAHLMHEYTFFKEFSGQELIKYLQAYQKKAAQSDDLNRFRDETAKAYMALRAHTDTLESYRNYGTVFMKGLFAGKPDPNGMVFTDHGRKSEKLEEWQKAINSIIMEPGDYLKSNELLEYAVMGNFLSEKVIDRMREQFPDRDENHYNYTTLQVTYFDNMLDNKDSRFDSQELRATVAEARKEVKQEIESGSWEKLQEDLQSAFDVMYRHACEVYLIEEPSFYYCSLNLDRLLALTEQNGIKLNISDQQREMLKVVREKRELVQRRIALREKLRLKAASLYHEEADDPSRYPGNDQDTYEDFVEAQALADIFKRIQIEVDTTRKCYQNPLGLLLNNMPDRNLTMTEKLMAENPKGLLSYYKNQVRQSDAMREVLDVSDKKNLFNTLLNGGYRIGSGPKAVDYYDAIAFERGAAGRHIKTVLDGFDAALKRFDDDLDAETHALKKDVRKILVNLKASLEKLRDARAKIAEPWTEKGLKMLEPYYNAVAKYYDDYSKIIDRDDAYEIGFAEGVGSLQGNLDFLQKHAEGIETWRSGLLESRKITGAIADARLVTNFEKSIQEHCDHLNALVDKKTIGKDFTNLQHNMALFHSIWSGTRAENIKYTGTDILSGKGLYRVILGNIDELLKSKSKGVNSDVKYILNSMKTQMLADLTECSNLSNSENFLEDFENAQYHYSTENSIRNTERLKTVMEQMRKVSSRTGGNSDEFNDILDKMEAVKNLQKQGNTASRQYLEAVEALSLSADTYIKAKKIVPGSSKGKERLNIAKNMRDLCRNLTVSVSCAIENAEKSEAMTGYTDIVKTIKNKKNAALKDLEEVVSTIKMYMDAGTMENHHDTERFLQQQLRESAGRLVYLDQVDKSAYNFKPDQLKKLITDEYVKNQTAEIEPGIIEALKTLSNGDLVNAFKDHTLCAILSDRAKPFRKPEQLERLKNANANIQNPDAAIQRQ